MSRSIGLIREKVGGEVVKNLTKYARLMQKMGGNVFTKSSHKFQKRYNFRTHNFHIKRLL